MPRPWVHRLLAASLLASAGLVALELWLRPYAPLWSSGGQALAAFGVIVATTTGLSVLVACAAFALGRLRAWLRTRIGRAASPLTALVGGLTLSGTLASTAIWAFSGQRAEASGLGRVGPALVLVVLTLAGAAGIGLVDLAARRAARRRTLVPLSVSVMFVSVAALLLVADQTVLVALYQRVHRALEYLATLLLFGAFWVALTTLEASQRRARRVVRALGLAAFVYALGFALVPGLRGAQESALQHVADEPSYAARALRRVEVVRATLRGEDGELGLSESRLGELLARYDVPESARDPRWDAPYVDPPEVARHIDALRERVGDVNIVVFYVDTLRYDITRDEDTMPHTAAFGKAALRFDRAYSSGSDTLTALPAMLGGHFDLRRARGPFPDWRTKASHERPTLLEVARDREVVTSLFIPESAYEFLTKLLPRFEFDEVHRARDHEKAGVWGYGADSSTAEAMVSEALDWMSQREEGSRFFAWVFNFDVHAWRELDGRYIAAAAQRFGMTDDGDRAFRYRVAARGVDEAFGRLVEGIEQLGMADDTVIVFVSDHGEALGEEDFWVHSVFLWESLVRVPLILRVPKIAPRAIDEAVSLVDVAPTLARFVHPAAPMVGYQGEDLLARLAPDPQPRRLPILLAATSDQRLSRLGVVDPPYKLVLPADWGAPELYRLDGEAPDRQDVAEAEPRTTLEMMNVLLRSPVFVNAYQDAKEANP